MVWNKYIQGMQGLYHRTILLVIVEKSIVSIFMLDFWKSKLTQKIPTALRTDC